MLNRFAAVVEESLREEGAADLSTAAMRIRRSQHASLSRCAVALSGAKSKTSACRKFIDVMTEYSKMQADYRERCKGRIQRQLEICEL